MKRNTRRRWIAFVSLFALASCQSEDPTDQNPQPDNSQVEPSGQKPSVQDPNPDPTPQEPSPGGDASTSAGESGSNGSTTTGGDSGGSTSSDPGTEDSSEDETDSSDDGKIDCASLKVTGSNIGQVPMNLELINAKGDKVSLHEHCNDVLYIAAATAY